MIAFLERMRYSYIIAGWSYGKTYRDCREQKLHRLWRSKSVDQPLFGTIGYSRYNYVVIRSVSGYWSNGRTICKGTRLVNPILSRTVAIIRSCGRTFEKQSNGRGVRCSDLLLGWKKQRNSVADTMRKKGEETVVCKLCWGVSGWSLRTSRNFVTDIF